jgi:hypothetical protein
MIEVINQNKEFNDFQKNFNDSYSNTSIESFDKELDTILINQKDNTLINN